MKKLLALITTITMLTLCITSCSNIPLTGMDIEDPVTMEQLNTTGEYVSRGFIESIFTDNEEMFNACYPDGFIDSINSESDVPVFEEFKAAMNVDGEFLGTMFEAFNNYTEEEGYDEAGMRTSISFITGIPEEEIEALEIDKVKVYFKDSEGNAAQSIYFLVYSYQGEWYMYNVQNEDAEFKN
ncbi:MAG: hypothetical protein K5745_03285 [Saccharofermentans sp.]|nr:hypothetical protein [Saccharofermentans sp.]